MLILQGVYINNRGYNLYKWVISLLVTAKGPPKWWFQRFIPHKPGESIPNLTWAYTVIGRGPSSTMSPQNYEK